MADTILKSKAQLRSISVTSNGSSNGGDKTPTTPSKLMINHGKPNFTIQRSPKVDQNGDGDPFASNKNNNYNAFKTASVQSYSNNNIVVGTKFNGVFRPTNIPITPKQPHQSDASDNDSSWVVLRRPKAPEPSLKDDEDDAVPEFIRRQRRIQERLAKENILDFESRRSGYFTHVMITPTSPNRQSFGATMSSPPIVPALETPAPTVTPTVEGTKKVEEKDFHAEPAMTNGNSTSIEHNAAVEEEEVAKAIEEVNKAVEGEDDEFKDEHNSEVPVVGAAAVATTWEIIPEPTTEENEHTQEVKTTITTQTIQEEHKHVETEYTHNESTEEVTVTSISVVTTSDAVEDNVEHNVDAHQPPKTTEAAGIVEEAASEQNGHIEVVEVHASQDNDHNDITISHTNGFDGPSIPAPDPSGALGVNYEPKTVVSFSKDLGSEPNKYPDTVKVVNQNGDEVSTAVDERLQELSKLKFDIKADEQDVHVTPVLRAD